MSTCNTQQRQNTNPSQHNPHTQPEEIVQGDHQATIRHHRTTIGQPSDSHRTTIGQPSDTTGQPSDNHRTTIGQPLKKYARRHKEVIEIDEIPDPSSYSAFDQALWGVDSSHVPVDPKECKAAYR